MKVNLYLWKWKWLNIDTEEAKKIVNEYSTLIDHILTKKSAFEDYKTILFDIDDIETGCTTLARHNDENGKRFISIMRAKGDLI